MAAQTQDNGEVVLDLIEGDKSVRVALNRRLSGLLLEMLRVIGRGDAVTLVPVSQQLTTQQAADLLNVSRPYFIDKLLEPGLIPYTKVGRHRRISADDVFAYRNTRQDKRARALTELARTDADLLQVFANRFTALIDACSLVGVLSRNTLLSLAEAELYRARWSDEILKETEKALSEILLDHKRNSPNDTARAQVERVKEAFPEGLVEDYEIQKGSLEGLLPDGGDTHVLAAAVKCRASVIVTENIKHFPKDILLGLNLEALTADEFVANTIDLSPQKAVVAISAMRARFDRPEISASELLLFYEKRGFIQTADILREHVLSL